MTTARAKPDDRDHYSYAVYADPAMAESFDALRFGGPIGALLAESQERVITSFLSPLAGRTILDVGTGTGRAAIALALKGARRDRRRRVGRDACASRGARAAMRRPSVSVRSRRRARLAFPDRSFDAVICLRVLMHTPDWRAVAWPSSAASPAIASCSTIRRSRAPPRCSRLARRRGAAPGARVEAYRVFTDRDGRATALAADGFRVVDAHRQFVLPIALHKAARIRRRRPTRIEGALARVGLQRLLGSPVTIVAERCAS